MSPDFPRIYDENRGFVWRMLARCGVRSASLEDALQDVFVVVHRRLGDFDGRQSIRAWLFGIVRKVAATHARTERRVRRRQEALLPQSSGARPDEQLVAKQTVAFVEDFLARLPREQREVFVLSEVEGWTAPEIAEAVEAPVGTVYSRLHAARARFATAVARWSPGGRP